MSPPVRAIVVVPTHDHALTLPHALRSVQRQTVEDLRIVVIGDGVGDDTRQVVAEFMALDPRVGFLDRPKTGRTGELLRHELLSGLDDEDATAITYLGDDDLLLSDHVECVIDTLVRNDLVHPLMTCLNEHGVLLAHPLDLGDAAWAEIEFRRTLVSLTGLAHTLGAYRRLPYGWRSTPVGGPTDQYMVQQFIAQPWCRASVLDRPTMLRMPSAMRRAMEPEDRAAEVATWADRLSGDGGEAWYRAEVDAALRRSGSVMRRAAMLRMEQIERLQAEREEMVARHAAEIALLRQRAEAAETRCAALERETEPLSPPTSLR